MKVLGIDFTSSPTRRKPLTCLRCVSENGVLRAQALENWHAFADFDAELRALGPWIAGIDFPFGQSRKFITNNGWPPTWKGYVDRVYRMEATAFYNELTVYRNSRPRGCKEHRRATDRTAKSISPQKMYGVPVAKMFFQGAPRLLQAGVTIPGIQVGDPSRVVVEAYPKLPACKFGGGKSYKNDRRSKQSEDHYKVRCEIVEKIISGGCLADYKLQVETPESLAGELVSDPTGDKLDALLCAIQAAWSWTQRDAGFGAPSNLDSLEGWIADPSLRDK